MFVGSDALALSPMTRRITYLEEGDRAVVHRSGARRSSTARAGRSSGRSAPSRSSSASPIAASTATSWPRRSTSSRPCWATPSRATSRRAARRSLRRRKAVDWAGLSRLLIVACGTAAYAGQVAKYWFEQLARIPVEVDIASEFRYREPPLDGRELALFISQSGETADTMAALRHVSGRVAGTLGIINVEESSMAREVGIVLPTLAGREIGVASTKAFTCQLMVLAATAILAARAAWPAGASARGGADPQPGRAAAADRDGAGAGGLVDRISQEISFARNVLYLGRGSMYPIALEGALKLKEISYIHAEGYASGELKHGPIALIDETVPVVVMAPRDRLFDKTVSNMQEVMARGGKVVLVTDRDGRAAAGDGAWRTIVLPDCEPFAAPMLYAIIAQQLAYFTALARGTDVDQPRNLAKSVTVE